MKLIILLAVVAWSNGAKLDKTYLPPSHAQTSGGSGNFLEAPLQGPARYQPINRFINNNELAQNDIGSDENRRAQNGNLYAQTGNNYAQAGNNYAQAGNNYAQAGNNYAQAGNDYSRTGNDYARTGNGYDNANAFGNNLNNFDNRPERAQAALERNAAILRQDNQNDGETYSYAYDTENGIYAEESGVATNGVEAQGGYSYTGDDGQVYSVRYTAGQNGFVPEGDHLPTAPPVPEEILKALEQNARDEAAGIYDDGSYSEGKYTDAKGTGFDRNSANIGAPNFAAQNNNYFNNGDTVVTNSARFPASGELNKRFDDDFNQNFRLAEANKAYLPPNESQTGFARTAPAANGRNGLRTRSRQPTFNARTGYKY